MTRQTLYRTIATVVMVMLLGGLLVWQHHRDQIVADCVARGGTWDGRAGRCKLLPPIYLERGIKRSQFPSGTQAAHPFWRAQKRSIL